MTEDPVRRASARSASAGFARPLAIAALALGLSACSTMTPTADPTSGAGPAPVLAKEAPPVLANDSAFEIAAATPAVLPVAVQDEAPRMSLVSRDLWDRIRDGFAMPELDTPLVAQKEAFYLERPDYLQRMFARGSRYLHHIVEEIEKRGMPTELALLPFVESAMNPTALSSAKAAGLWQFIPSTGKQYDLSQNWWVDNRRDVVQSTRAALDYLQYIHELNDNDWFLALASYNWGEGAVGRAVKRNKAAGKPAGYLDLKMPNETRHYVPKLIALKHILLRANELGVALPELPDRPYFVTIEKTRPIDLKLAAEFAGMSVADFVALNPAHNRPVVSASANNVLKIPADRIEDFMAAMARHERAEKVFASWQPYTLKPGETLDEVARRGNVTPDEVLRANSIATGIRVLPGTRILAPQKLVEDERAVERFTGARVYQMVNVPARFHRVQRSDTLVTIARRHGVTVAELRAMNGNPQRLRAGSTMQVSRPTTQTVLVTESGQRQVVANRKDDIVRTATTSAPAPAALPARAAPARAGTANRGSVQRAVPARKTPVRATGAARSVPAARQAAPKAASTRNTVNAPAADRKAGEPTRSASAGGPQS